MSSFYDSFSACMAANQIPVPDASLSTAAAIDLIVEKINEGVARFGPDVTVGELVQAGFLADYWVAAGALTASYVAGVAVGCAGQAALGG